MLDVCPNLLATGSCLDNDCSDNHDVYVCAPCSVVTRSECTRDAHLNGARHRKRVQGRTQIMRCPICSIVVFNASFWRTHVNGKKHKHAAQVLGISAAVEPEEAGGEVRGHVFCSVCETYVHRDAWDKHPLGRLHQMKIKYGALRSAMEEAAKDKHGVTVSCPDGIDFGVINSGRGEIKAEIALDIQTTVPLSNVYFVEARLTPKSRYRRASAFMVTSNALGAKLVYGRTAKATASFTQEHLGIYEDRVELVFEDTRLNKRFMIARTVRAIIASPEYNDLQPKAPFVPKKRTSRNRAADIEPGDPPPALGAIPYVVKLPLALIPDYITKILSTSGSLANTIRNFKSSVLPRVLQDATYGRHFKGLLWAEEYRSEQDLQIYDIADTTLNRHNSYYYLEVPGLAEKRPSVLVGDSILIQPVSFNIDADKWFEGCVHVVRKEEVGMKFGRGFPMYTPSQRYRARFRLNRYPLRRQHQALDSAFAPARLLFPTTGDILDDVRPTPGAGLRIYNKLIAQNPPQLQAVTSIMRAPAGSPPFALHGPPGTGKTVTVVEAIRQILDRNPQAKILACAPSNSAADIIAERLTMLGTDVLFRFYAPSRHKSQVPDALSDFTRTTSTGLFTTPPMATLKRFRVIVSTCVSASFAHGVGMPQGHFTHIFIDEAGQATEPEVMVGIKTIADNDTNVVLSGDPKQLGPIIRSAVARELGLEKSYLERIMEAETHHAQRWQGVMFIQLTQNFRSHPSILDFPNERFYNSSLRPYGDPEVINSYIGSSILVNPKFPVVFHALSGQDAREASSPSFFNVLQAIQVKKYVEQLRFDRRVRIADKDIGVITPYHAQCLRIRSVLRGFADDIKVGSVEEFQGQERRVIIISTVRSSREFVEYDLKHTLGFLANPRRLNVAVTRAQALLIIVGDPDVLSLDPLWRSFLNYIYSNGGWRGDRPAWDTEAPVREGGGYDVEAREAGMADMNDMMRRIESLTLQGLANDDAEDEEEDNVDRPWTEME